MDQARLAALLVARGDVERHACVQLSATKFVRAEQWAGLKRDEQEFLRCYAAGVSAHRAVLVGRSAARALGLWVLGKDPEVIELAQRNGHPPSKTQWPEGVVYRNIPVPEMDIREHTAFDPAGAGGRIRLTTPARTAIDIARFHGGTRRRRSHGQPLPRADPDRTGNDPGRAGLHHGTASRQEGRGPGAPGV